MTADVSERANVQQEHPEIVARLTKLIEKYVADGRSTPGPMLKNDVPINIWKAKALSKDDEGKDITHD
jgi:hypothetical protein